jgi:hypothetical protein
MGRNISVVFLKLAAYPRIGGFKSPGPKAKP